MLTDQVSSASRAEPAIEKQLDQIEYLANRVTAYNERIRGFLDCYHGVIPPAGDQAMAEVPSGYRGQINRLTKAIDEMDVLTSNLREIG